MFLLDFQLYISTNFYPPNQHIAKTLAVRAVFTEKRGGDFCATRRIVRILPVVLVDFAKKYRAVISFYIFKK